MIEEVPVMKLKVAILFVALSAPRRLMCFAASWRQSATTPGRLVYAHVVSCNKSAESGPLIQPSSLRVMPQL